MFVWERLYFSFISEKTYSSRGGVVFTGSCAYSHGSVEESRSRGILEVCSEWFSCLLGQRKKDIFLSSLCLILFTFPLLVIAVSFQTEQLIPPAAVWAWQTSMCLHPLPPLPERTWWLALTSCHLLSCCWFCHHFLCSSASSPPLWSSPPTYWCTDGWTLGCYGLLSRVTFLLLWMSNCFKSKEKEKRRDSHVRYADITPLWFFFFLINLTVGVQRWIFIDILKYENY